MSSWFFGGSKGGPGKSTVSRAAISRAISLGKAIAVVDCDGSNPDVYRAVTIGSDTVQRKTKVGVSSAEHLSLSTDKDVRVLAKLLVALSDKDLEIFINMGAGDDQLMRRIGSDMAILFAALKSRADAKYICDVNHEIDSFNLADDFIKRFADSLPVVILKNLHAATAEQFTYFNKPKFIEFCKSKRVVIGEFPALAIDIQKQLVDGRHLLHEFASDCDIIDAVFVNKYIREVDEAFRAVEV